MGMQELYTPITVAELADKLGHSGTDALRKRWKLVLPNEEFSSKKTLSQVEYLALTSKSKTHGTSAGAERKPNNPVPPSVPAPPLPPAGITPPPPVPANPPIVPANSGNNPLPAPAPIPAPVPAKTGTESASVPAPWIVRNASVVAMSASVLLLVTASVIAVGEVIRESSPVGWFAYVVGLVICAAPLIILTAGERLDQHLAYATMAMTLLIEIFCNAVAINRHTTHEFVSQVHHTTAMSDITLAWGLGIGLPVLALLLEISLLNIVKK